MGFPFLKDPGQNSLMVTLTLITTVAAVARFLLDGVSITINSQTFVFGHVDSLSYTAILAPILGAHGWIAVKGNGPTDKGDK